MWPDAAAATSRRRVSSASHRGPRARPAHHGSVGRSRNSQIDLGLSRYLVNDNRLAKGREVLTKYKAAVDATEKAYGVDRYAIAAIWGIESNYSTRWAIAMCCNHRDWPASAAAELFPRRVSFGAEILHRGDLRPEQMRGSWAGAFGRRSYADGSSASRSTPIGDGPATWSTIRRLIASTANN